MNHVHEYKFRPLLTPLTAPVNTALRVFEILVLYLYCSLVYFTCTSNWHNGKYATRSVNYRKLQYRHSAVELFWCKSICFSSSNRALLGAVYQIALAATLLVQRDKSADRKANAWLASHRDKWRFIDGSTPHLLQIVKPRVFVVTVSVQILINAICITIKRWWEVYYVWFLMFMLIFC